MKSLKHVVCVTALLGLFLFGLGVSAPKAVAGGPNPVVIMETSMGRVIVMLYPDKAPITVENFLRYVDKGFYDGTIFHRILQMDPDKYKDERVKAGMINIVQGGGFTYPPLQMKRPLWAPIKSEDSKGLGNVKGTIGMARTDNPDSATCQFFFNVADNPGLNLSSESVTDRKTGKDKSKTRRGYCSFGKVIRGWDTVEKMHQVKTGRMGRYEDVPVEPIYLLKAYRAR